MKVKVIACAHFHHNGSFRCPQWLQSIVMDLVIVLSFFGRISEERLKHLAGFA